MSSSLPAAVADHWRDWAAFLFLSGTSVAAAAIEAACGIGSEECTLSSQFGPGTQYTGNARCYNPEDGRVQYGDTVLTVTALSKIAAVFYFSRVFIFTPLALVVGASLSYSFHASDLMTVFNADVAANLIILLAVASDFLLLADAYPRALRACCKGVPTRWLLFGTLAVANAALGIMFSAVVPSLASSGKTMFLNVWTVVLFLAIVYIGWTQWPRLTHRYNFVVSLGAFIVQAILSSIDGTMGYECAQNTLFESFHTWNHIIGAVALVFIGRGLWKNAPGLKVSLEGALTESFL